MILNSAKHNRQLPAVVEAFFIMKDYPMVSVNLGPNFDVDTIQAHEAFLLKYQKSALEVPLLVFDPFNWDEPFTTFES